MHRQDTIAHILESMTLTKRCMAGYIQEVMKELPVSPAQLELLFNISQYQPMSAKTLAENRQLTPGAISQLTEALETNGLIKREQADDDRRSYLLRVTKKGEELVQTVHKRRDELFQAVLQNFSDTELEDWLHLQQKLVAELEQHKPEQTKP